MQKRENIKQYISRWKNSKWISVLKRGLYELTFPGQYSIPDMYIANRLYAPSYVSHETALSYYSIIPAISMAVVSNTPKITRQIRNRHGIFIYHKVKPKAFCGYQIEKQNGYNILISEPEKALIDYLYFKTYNNKMFNLSDERVDVRVISRLNRKKLKNYASIYDLSLKETF